MLYAATFSFEKYDSLDASSGTMGALIESDSPEQAVEKLEKLIRETAEDNASLFDGVENIFLDSLIEVKDSIPNGIITNITLFSDMAFQDLAEFNDELDEEVDDDYENEEFEASEEDEDDEDDDDEDDLDDDDDDDDDDDELDDDDDDDDEDEDDFDEDDEDFDLDSYPGFSFIIPEFDEDVVTAYIPEDEDNPFVVLDFDEEVSDEDFIHEEDILYEEGFALDGSIRDEDERKA